VRRSLGFVVAIVVLWILAWGALSPANLLSGLAVAVVLLAAAPEARAPFHLPPFRPRALARLGWRLARDLVASNVVLTREVLTPRPRIATGVVDVALPGCSDELLTVLANLLSMTPGTMPLEIRRDPTVMVVHILHLDDVEAVRARIRSLRDLLVRALGSPEAIAALPEAGP
jgi:multicomponent Na+:H+ antiporter subunit E